MPGRPEIGNIQLYPDRPLNKTDRGRLCHQVLLPSPSRTRPQKLRHP